MIAFYIGNHGNNVHTQDILEYIDDGLRAIGEAPCFFFDKFFQSGINITLEGFNQHVTGSIIGHQRQFQHSKLFIIVSESLSEGTFNSANLQDCQQMPANHYENSGYWATRYKCFTQLLSVTSGIIANSESTYREYTNANFGVPVFYLPMAALPTHVPITQISNDGKDIDIFFSGTVTEYRSGIIEQFKSFGLNVFTASTDTPEYLRRHLLARSKLAVGLKLGESTSVLSKARAHYCLTRRCPHLFEVVPEKTDLDPYLTFSSHADIVVAARDLLASGCAFDKNIFEQFKSALPYTEIFLSLNAFFQNCPVRRHPAGVNYG
ncbi:MAG: hypothetical protein QX199_04600 [Methylococcaceae bacterium]